MFTILKESLFIYFLNRHGLLKTHNPLVKSNVRNTTNLLALTAMNHWHLIQLDVNNLFYTMKLMMKFTWLCHLVFLARRRIKFARLPSLSMCLNEHLVISGVRNCLNLFFLKTFTNQNQTILYSPKLRNLIFLFF